MNQEHKRLRYKQFTLRLRPERAGKSLPDGGLS
jgi:hypothetical protein